MSRQLDTEELFERQKKHLTACKHSVGPVVIAENIHTPDNMAAILRVAEAAGSKRVIFINEKQLVISKKMARIARGANKYLQVEFCDLESFEELCLELPELIALEITS